MIVFDVYIFCGILMAVFASSTDRYKFATVDYVDRLVDLGWNKESALGLVALSTLIIVSVIWPVMLFRLVGFYLMSGKP
jgi:hypothetical protein